MLEKRKGFFYLRKYENFRDLAVVCCPTQGTKSVLVVAIRPLQIPVLLLIRDIYVLSVLIKS